MIGYDTQWFKYEFQNLMYSERPQLCMQFHPPSVLRLREWHSYRLSGSSQGRGGVNVSKYVNRNHIKVLRLRGAQRSKMKQSVCTLNASTVLKLRSSPLEITEAVNSVLQSQHEINTKFIARGNADWLRHSISNTKRLLLFINTYRLVYICILTGVAWCI